MDDDTLVGNDGAKDEPSSGLDEEDEVGDGRENAEPWELEEDLEE